MKGWTKEAALFAARIGWLVVGILSLVLFVATLDVRYDLLRTVCEATCRDVQLSSVQMEQWKEWSLPPGLYAGYHMALDVLVGLVCLAVALIIMRSRLHSFFTVFVSLMLLTTGFGLHLDRLREARADWVWAINIVDLVGSGFLVMFYVFPDGRFVPRWTQYMAGFWIFSTMGKVFLPGTLADPMTWPIWLNLPGWIGVFSSAFYAQVYRYRHYADAVQRQQTKWFIFGLGAIVVGLIWAGITDLVPPTSSGALGILITLLRALGLSAFALCPPLAIFFAIRRYRLWDVDLIINRTAVYGTLIALVTLLYAGVVGGLGVIFQTSGQPALAFVATAVVVVAFSPLRDRLQRGVNRMMYGDRDQPFDVVTRLGKRLEAIHDAQGVLLAVAETVATAMKLPFVAVDLATGKRLVAYGSAVEEPVVLPLVYQAEPVGQLILGPRAPGESFTPADYRLLSDLARQVGLAVHAVQLTMDLQRSRERVVTTREEERRRLRRDLHDGLGPLLASLTITLDTAEGLVERNPAEVRRLLVQLRNQTQAAITDVRQLVYGLRPPAIDEFGLIGALREKATSYSRNGVTVLIEGAEPFPQVSAAAEVAAYHIAMEALNNTSRHAGPCMCIIRIWVDGALHLEIADNGKGYIPGRNQGVGLSSMRERAAELNGSLRIESAPDRGTCVYARLPLPEGE